MTNSTNGPNQLLLLSLEYGQFTWNLVYLHVLKLSFTWDENEVICKLCKKKSNDIVTHFIIECPTLFQSRDVLLEKVVNCINVRSYVDFSFLEETDQASFLLGDRTKVTLHDDEWNALMVMVATNIKLLLNNMNSVL